MSRIPTPASIDASPPAAQHLLQAVKQQLGRVPNLFRLVGTSPAAVEGYLALSGALGKGALDARTRERIALAVAEINGCDSEGAWLRAHGNEQWEFDAHGLMQRREASINDVSIRESDRLFHWPPGPRPAEHPSLSGLGL